MHLMIRFIKSYISEFPHPREFSHVHHFTPSLPPRNPTSFSLISSRGSLIFGAASRCYCDLRGNIHLLLSDSKDSEVAEVSALALLVLVEQVRELIEILLVTVAHVENRRCGCALEGH